MVTSSSRPSLRATARIRLPSPPPRSATRLAWPRCRAMMRALPMTALTRRRSARERTARGSSGGRWSSHSGSSDLEKRPMAAESGAEGRHPPPAARRLLAQRGLQHEEDERAAQVAEARQQVAAAPHLLLGKLQRLAHPVEHRLAARVPDPVPYFMEGKVVGGKARLEDGSRVLGGELGHAPGEDVAQQAAALLHAQRVALGGLVQRG